MKIVALHTDFRIYWPARLKALAAALQSRGDSLDVIEIAGKGSPYAFADNSGESGLNWHILFPEAKPEDLSGKEIEPILFRVLDEIQPDVIIAGAIAFPSGALAVRYGYLHKTRIITFDDTKIDNLKRSPLVNFIKRQVYNGVDAMFYPSEDLVPTGQFWGFNKERMYFGVDVVDNDFWSKLTNINNIYSNYFINVGRQIPCKNLMTLLKAYLKYSTSVGFVNAINLLMIGDGSDQPELKAFIKNNGLTHKVKFLPFKTQDELVGLYQNAQALCMPSQQETWGLVINEALAAGCPVFASNQCGASNVLIKTGINGYKFDCHDVDALAEIMLQYHNLTDQERLEMRKNCKNIISAWGLDRFSSSLLQAIDYVTSHNKRTSTIVSKLIISKWKGQYRPI